MSDERDAPFTIAFEDEHLIVVDKAPGVVVHPARGHREDTLSQLLAPLLDGDDAADPERRGIVHRLDRDTSGLLVVARSRGGAPPPAGGARATADRARISRARRGTPAGAHGHDRGADRPRPARAHAHGRRRRRRRARRARTSRSSARSRTPRCCACDWRPGARTRSACTCRRSATRCAATPSTAPRGASGWQRQFLHATRLAFEHPLTGEQRGRQLAAARGPATRAVERAERAILIAQI